MSICFAIVYAMSLCTECLCTSEGYIFNIVNNPIIRYDHSRASRSGNKSEQSNNFKTSEGQSIKMIYVYIYNIKHMDFPGDNDAPK